MYMQTRYKSWTGRAFSEECSLILAAAVGGVSGIRGKWREECQESTKLVVYSVQY